MKFIFFYLTGFFNTFFAKGVFAISLKLLVDQVSSFYALRSLLKHHFSSPNQGTEFLCNAVGSRENYSIFARKFKVLLLLYIYIYKYVNQIALDQGFPKWTMNSKGATGLWSHNLKLKLDIPKLMRKSKKKGLRHFQTYGNNFRILLVPLAIKWSATRPCDIEQKNVLCVF